MGGVRSTFPGTFESGSTGTSPGDNITLHIGNGDGRVIERGVDVSPSFGNLFMGFMGPLLLWHLLNDLLTS